MKRLLVLSTTLVVAVASLLTISCSQASPAPAATSAPASKSAEPTTKPADSGVQPPASATAAPAKKRDWPQSGKSLTFIVGTQAGGSSDVGFRTVASFMEKELGIPIQVVNKPAGGQQEGLTELAKAKPDGYTIGMTSMPQAIAIYLDPERKAIFNRKSFQPIGMHVVDPGVIAVRTESPFKTLQDLIDAVKANPNKITASTTGIMGDDHLSLLRTQQALNIRFAPVHFTQGGAPSIAALLGGHVDVNFNNVGDYMSQYKSGQVRILAILDKEQSKFYPGVKTFEEQTGIKLYSASSRGVSAPAGVPSEVMDILAAAFKKAWENPEHQKIMFDRALSLRYMSPAEMSAYWEEMEAEMPRLMEEARKDPGELRE